MTRDHHDSDSGELHAIHSRDRRKADREPWWKMWEPWQWVGRLVFAVACGIFTLSAHVVWGYMQMKSDVVTIRQERSLIEQGRRIDEQRADREIRQSEKLEHILTRFSESVEDVQGQLHKMAETNASYRESQGQALGAVIDRIGIVEHEVSAIRQVQGALVKDVNALKSGKKTP